MIAGRIRTGQVPTREPTIAIHRVAESNADRKTAPAIYPASRMLHPADAKAFLFDLDGVLTPTAVVHRAAWKETFDALLDRLDQSRGFTEEDYLAHVDGKPRYDGVRSFLSSRNIDLPEGSPDDAGGLETIQAVGNAKNRAFRTVLTRDGIDPYPGSLALIDLLDERGTPWAVVSSSANATDVLDAAGLAGRPQMVIDGIVAARESLPGKPDPSTFLAASSLLGLQASDCVVVEDAISGVAAGRSGGFGLVLGVAREVDPGELVAAGAHRVVSDLSEVVEDLR